MIIRNYTVGDKLDVAGLNQINVLLDRSETIAMEIGYNEWPKAVDGPPHRHEDKDQVFCFLHGSGQVKANGKTFRAEPGSLLHIPAYTLHQTINPVDEPLGYLLLNVFNSDSKEGHASFKEHIEIVKATRRQQADSQEGGYEAEADGGSPRRAERFVEGMEAPAGQSKFLLNQESEDRFQLRSLSLEAGAEERSSGISGVERAVFVLSGEGSAELNGDRASVRKGDLLYIPPGQEHQLSASSGEPLGLLILDTTVS